jgi:hypothetical protein
MGVKRIVALRGDLPSGYGAGGEFQYASDLVAFIRAETGSAFRIEVACYPEVHPQAKSPRGRPAGLRRQGRGRRRFGHHAVLLQRRRLLPLRRRSAQAGRRRCRWCRASCRSPIRASCCASRMRAAPRSRAGSACGCRLRRRHGVDQGLRPRRGQRPVRAAARGGAPGLHFYTMNQAAADAGAAARPAAAGFSVCGGLIRNMPLAVRPGRGVARRAVALARLADVQRGVQPGLAGLVGQRLQAARQVVRLRPRDHRVPDHVGAGGELLQRCPGCRPHPPVVGLDLVAGVDQHQRAARRRRQQRAQALEAVLALDGDLRPASSCSTCRPAPCCRWGAARTATACRAPPAQQVLRDEGRAGVDASACPGVEAGDHSR